jgi:tRNA/rRNA methyltransferase
MNNTHPIIILSHPQLNENIGAVARCMMNFGCHELRLINPTAHWHDDKTIVNAKGADEILNNALVFNSLDDAIADLHTVYATGAAHYHMVKPIYTPKQLIPLIKNNHKTGIVFGCERVGLSQNEIARCHGLITIPTIPDFSSLNLSQAVLVFVYEWYCHDQSIAQIDNSIHNDMHTDSKPATQSEVTYFLSLLEKKLDDTHYWRVDHKKPIMHRNVNNIVTRMNLSQQEVRTLVGIVNTLTEHTKNKENKNDHRQKG